MLAAREDHLLLSKPRTRMQHIMLQLQRLLAQLVVQGEDGLEPLGQEA